MGTGGSQSAKPQTKFPAEEFFEAEFQLRNNVGHGKALEGPAFFQDVLKCLCVQEFFISVLLACCAMPQC